MRLGSETLAKGKVAGPEDLLYDATLGVVYTGCEDGWIKRVTLNESVDDSVVENWVNTGGRPLGLAFYGNGDLIVADADLGLLRITREKEIEVLVNEIEGLKFKLTDGVDVANDGTIYFTDASYKYSVKDSILDILEGNPNGRFLSYNPTTKKTTLLLTHLYFPNGVAVSPDQQFVVFCETVLMNCKKYYIKGQKRGSIEKFCDLPGMPDNIHYDGHGLFWIGIATGITPEMDLMLRYPIIRKTLAIVTKKVPSLNLSKKGGVITVDLEGKPITHYYDPKLSLTIGIKIGNHIYCGSILYPYLIRLNIEQYPALPTI
ncbi:protein STRICTOSIDINE SYNTHASE-LIKE 5-like isoform X2 [Cicer arietinum]|nr:protein STRICTOSIDINE SYNTHASE-LIKE 5-like isoform X2 [Cicer arietinum]